MFSKTVLIILFTLIKGANSKLRTNENIFGFNLYFS